MKRFRCCLILGGVGAALAIMCGCAQNPSTPAAPPSPTAAIAAPAPTAAAPFIYQDPTQPIEARISDVLVRLTLGEKITLLHAESKFGIAGVPRLGIPYRWTSDGPHGVREEIGPYTWNKAGRTDDFVTCFPCGICLAATWDPELAQAEGATIGEEALKRNKDIMLGPAVNIQRTPLNGRTFEYFGEDPWLSSRIAVGYIEGEQSQDVASCVKHFAANNQETNRTSVDVEVDERTLREIYLPAFEAAVREAHVWAIMAAYNKLRGTYCAANDYLLNQVLKGDWAFPGIVITDWAAAHDTRASALGGLDLEMGTDRPYDQFFFAQPLLDLVNSGDVPMAVIDDKVRRNLRVMFATHQFDGRPPGAINTAAHETNALRVAEEGMVLLKNDQNALPLDASKISSIAVIGENAVRLQTHGGDSSEIKAFYEITPLQGIVARAGRQVNITYSQGYADPTPGATRPVNPDALTADEDALADRAVQAAKQADIVIFVGGLNHDRGFDCEDADRQNMKLPYGQDDLLQRIVAANPRTIVVLVAGSPVEMGPWLEQAPAVLLSWYSGMEGGHALARILFGDVNPSGKLPCTFPKQLADSPAHSFGPETYPGVNGVENYTEGLLVGYRWFDTKKIEPLFPFGYGLSYTQFTYANLRLVPAAKDGDPVLTAQFDLTNSGARDGAEVAQLYVHQDAPGLPRPDKELKGFQKVFLRAGETQTVSIPLGQRAFAYYDPDKKGWLAEAGAYQILLGSSSRDIRLQDTFNLPAEIFAK